MPVGGHQFRNILTLFLAIVAGGLGLVWWAVAQADREVRSDLLQQTHMLARTLKIEDVQTLTRTATDLQQPEYLRIKEQFAAVRALIPQCSSIYLLSRPSGRADAAAPNRQISYCVGIGTDDDARPGQVYAGATTELSSAFESGVPFVEGPLADGTGAWICGIVPLEHLRTESSLVALGVRMDARDWKQQLLRAALPPALLTLGLAALQMLGVALIARRSRRAGPLPRGMGYLELILVILAGLMLTGCLTWMVHRHEARVHQQNFKHLVSLQTRGVSSRLRSFQSTELESLARLCESSGEFVGEEFQQFCAYLEKNQVVHAWGMVPAVAATDKSGFEAQARAAGAKDFEIWQKDAHGKREPASGRDVYFPVRQVVPMVGNESLLGYDLGSDPLCREAMETAARSGLTTVSEPIELVPKTGNPKDLVIFQPVGLVGAAPRLRGFVVANLSMEALLKTTPSDNSAYLGISLLRKDAPPEILVKQWEPANRPASGLSAERPVLAFGKAFTVTALAGPGFLFMRSNQKTWWPTTMGLVLTAAFAFNFGAQLNRRSILERLVAKRTFEIQDTETRFRQLAEASFEGVAIVDAGILLDGNQRYAEMHGYELAEMLGEPVLAFVALQSRHLLTKGDLQSPLRNPLVYGLRKDGSIFPTETRTRLGPWRGRSVRIVTVRDESEAHAVTIKVQALRDELAHAQRLALVSEISAGIIHQLGQPLSSIAINLAAFKNIHSAELQQANTTEIIHDVEADLVCMRNIVKHLRAIANPEQAKRGSRDLNPLVVEVLPFLQVDAEQARTRLELDLHEPLPAIHLDAIQISQVILNLARNAIEASADVPPEQRVVLITTRLQHAEHCVELCVRDSGTGLPREAFERLFTPFFTTKSNGMGVGLRLCQTIVHAHDGSIEGFNNADGPGATFRIRLPLNQPPS